MIERRSRVSARAPAISDRKKKGSAPAHLRDEHDRAAVARVGQGAGDQRQEEEGQCAGCLHQRDLVGGGGDRGHQPRGADRLDHAAEGRDQRGPPEQRERAMFERRERRAAPAFEM